ncbi:hypothetical protein EWW49_05750 [Pseudomonas syringae]|nr:hypothetical protein [Pseudomonas syringae pv. dysoxyli]QNR44970.1 hypothetical protein D5S12_18555 [Pseudomonas syringae]RVU50245.1 hypothetical protein EOL67_17970 [Pseudomonas syringae pv. syringae]TFZ39119.1 hypothetical protein EWW49_05750 [Pseudomonas syringae]
MPFWTLRVLLATQSVETCIPTRSVRNDSLNSVPKLCVDMHGQSDYRATLRVVMPFRTLRVLFATQSVETCIPTRSVRNDDLNYRAAPVALTNQ